MFFSYGSTTWSTMVNHGSAMVLFGRVVARGQYNLLLLLLIWLLW